jgi:hypothetical protein
MGRPEDGIAGNRLPLRCKVEAKADTAFKLSIHLVPVMPNVR